MPRRPHRFDLHPHGNHLDSYDIDGDYEHDLAETLQLPGLCMVCVCVCARKGMTDCARRRAQRGSAIALLYVCVSEMLMLDGDMRVAVMSLLHM